MRVPGRKTAFWFTFILLQLLMTLSASGCGGQRAAVNVSAAASLSDALKVINTLYVAGNPGIDIATNFGGSGTLQKQIENGAPVDIFMSAASAQMDAVQQKHLILDDTRRDLLANTVVLVTPSGNPAGIRAFTDLSGDRVKKVAIGDPGSVPAGAYAQMVFDKYGITGSVKPKLVLAGDVRQVLTYVESGNVDAGVVFLTDARGSNRVEIVANAPDEINAKVVYPIAIVQGSKNVDAARNYEKFLFGDQAKAVFEKYGFKVINK